MKSKKPLWKLHRKHYTTSQLHMEDWDEATTWGHTRPLWRQKTSLLRLGSSSCAYTTHHLQDSQFEKSLFTRCQMLLMCTKFPDLCLWSSTVRRCKNKHALINWPNLKQFTHVQCGNGVKSENKPCSHFIFYCAAVCVTSSNVKQR